MALSKNPTSTLPSTSVTSTYTEGHPLTIAGITTRFYNSISEINADWEIAAPNDNLFLQRTFLQLVEKSRPEGMQFCYLVFYKNQSAIGCAACQIQPFNAEKSLQSSEKMAKTGQKDKPTACFFTALGNYFKSFVASRFDFNALVCGNLLLTGEHGYYFQPDQVQNKNTIKIVEEGLDYARKQLRKQKQEIAVTLLKDYFEQSRPTCQTLVKDYKYNEFTIQPNMMMEIRTDWHSFEDYLAAMSSKYRVRVKRAAKKGKDIVRKEFSAADIEAHLDTMYSLYENVAISAGFNTVQLNRTYFLELKRALGDRFKLTAYFLDDQLIGYFTLIRNYHELEAHFLGFDKSKNGSHQVYLNMLYDMVRIGIEEGFERIVFARTALEIKSSVGAIAHDMYCYMRHKYNLSNKLFTPIYDYLKPELDWTPRHPFKGEIEH